jgi:hypothetical protein
MMQHQFTNEDHQLVQDEINRLGCLVNYNHSQFVADCRRYSGGLIEEFVAGGEFVADTVCARLSERKPFSMVRIGDGEGNVLSLADSGIEHLRELKWFNAIFYLQDRQILDIARAESFAETMENSVRNADVLGVREFPFYNDEDTELKTAQSALLEGDLRGSLGILRARHAFTRLLLDGRLVNTIVTSAWVHLALLNHLDKMAEAANKILVISGRTSLSAAFARRYDSKPMQFLSVPLEATADPDVERSHHFPETHELILSSMHGGLAGTLVLVGAGIFGKAYCQAAKSAGGVALDLGSAFDVLAGIKTRWSHDTKECFGIDVMRSL